MAEDGTVTQVVEFVAKMACNYDISKFPADVHVCAVELRPLISGVRFNLTQDVRLGTGFSSGEFEVSVRMAQCVVGLCGLNRPAGGNHGEGDVYYTGFEIVFRRLVLSNILIVILPTAILTYASILMFLHTALV